MMSVYVSEKESFMGIDGSFGRGQEAWPEAATSKGEGGRSQTSSGKSDTCVLERIRTIGDLKATLFLDAPPQNRSAFLQELEAEGCDPDRVENIINTTISQSVLVEESEISEVVVLALLLEEFGRSSHIDLRPTFVETGASHEFYIWAEAPFSEALYSAVQSISGVSRRKAMELICGGDPIHLARCKKGKPSAGSLAQLFSYLGCRVATVPLGQGYSEDKFIKVGSSLGSSEASSSLFDGRGSDQGKELFKQAKAMMAKRPLSADDIKDAIHLYERAIALGNLDSLCELGELYLQGMSSGGLGMNYEKAREYLMSAADEGVAVAQYRIGCMYLSGKGLEEDKEKARQWLLKSSGQGHAEATFRLGKLLYEEGESVRALQLLEKARQGGSNEAADFLSAVCLSLKGGR